MSETSVEHRLLELLTGVSHDEKEAMEALTSQGHSQAEDVADHFLRIKYSLKDGDSMTRKRFNLLKVVWSKMKEEPVLSAFSGESNLRAEYRNAFQDLLQPNPSDERFKTIMRLLNLFVPYTEYERNRSLMAKSRFRASLDIRAGLKD